MTVAEAEEILDSTDYIKSNDPFYEGLTILKKYSDGKEQFYNFEHDQMWTCDFEKYVKVMSAKDVKRMGELNWFQSEEAWSHFD